MTRILRAAVTDEVISLTDHEELVASVEAGAVVGFSGVVRNHDGGRQVLRLEYSAHPSAAETLFEVLAEVAGSASGVRALAASHRVIFMMLSPWCVGGTPPPPNREIFPAPAWCALGPQMSMLRGLSLGQRVP